MFAFAQKHREISSSMKIIGVCTVNNSPSINLAAWIATILGLKTDGKVFLMDLNQNPIYSEEYLGVTSGHGMDLIIDEYCTSSEHLRQNGRFAKRHFQARSDEIIHWPFAASAANASALAFDS
jgi:hypothetical protein